MKLYRTNGDRNKNLSVKEYLNEIKTLLVGCNNWSSSKDVDEKRVMHSNNSNTEFMTYDNANDVVDELFQ